MSLFSLLTWKWWFVSKSQISYRGADFQVNQSEKTSVDLSVEYEGLQLPSYIGIIS